MSAGDITGISTSGRALNCVPCQSKGHVCYAAKIVDGVPTCMYCLDNEPCIWEQRHRGEELRTCVHPGCRVPLISSNKAQLCSLHMAGGKAPVTRKASPTPVSAPVRPDPIPTQEMPAMETFDNCPRCGAPKHRGRCRGTSPGKNKPKTQESPEASTVMLQMTEKQLNAMILGCSLDEKARMLNALFAETI